MYEVDNAVTEGETSEKTNYEGISKDETRKGFPRTQSKQRNENDNKASSKESFAKSTSLLTAHVGL